MSIVSRYLLREFLIASAAVFLALVVTWMAADSLLNLDRLAGGGAGGLRALLVRALDLIGVGVPLACLAGVVWSLTRAVRNREITAIRCGGIPLRGALIPLLVASTLIAVGIGVFEDRVLMPARDAISRAESGDENAALRPGKIHDHWWYTNGSSVFSAEGYDILERRLRGVTVFRFDDERGIRERIDARSAINLEGSSWEFRSAVVRSFGDAGKLDRRDVQTMRVDLGVSSEDMERAAPAASATTLHKLARRIREHHGDLKVLAGLQSTFHSRLAQPFAVLIFVLLAIPFAIGDVERGDSLPRALLTSIACAGGYWLFWSAGQLASRSGAVPPFAPIWGVTLVALAIGFYRYRRIAE